MQTETDVLYYLEEMINMELATELEITLYDLMMSDSLYPETMYNRVVRKINRLSSIKF